MPVRIAHIIDTRIDNSPTSVEAVFDFGGVTPKRITLYVAAVKTLSPTSLTLTGELSPDDGQNLITYDKFLTEAGNDAPVASVVYTATGDDVVSLSPEDVVDFLKVTIVGAGTDATNYFDVDVWLVYAY